MGDLARFPVADPSCLKAAVGAISDLLAIADERDVLEWSPISEESRSTSGTGSSFEFWFIYVLAQQGGVEEQGKAWNSNS